MSVGSQIKQRRTELNMSQETLAEKIGVSRSAISNWEIERNYPDLQLIVSLSDVLDIPLDILLKGDTEVVEKISTDTVQRKKLSRKLNCAYVCVAVLIIMLGLALYKTRYLDISRPSQIESVEFDGDNKFFVKTDLPFYRSLAGYYIDYTNNGETMNISLFSYRDMSMTNLEEETVSAYLYPNTKKVAIVYDNEPLITYELDEIDVTNK